MGIIHTQFTRTYTVVVASEPHSQGEPCNASAGVALAVVALADVAFAVDAFCNAASC